MSLLISIPEMKRSTTEDLIETSRKISNILMERDLNDVEFDMDQVFRSLLADSCFNNSKDISVPFLVNESMIGVPSMMPNRDSSGNVRGDSVVPFIQIPGSEPYRGYSEDTATFVDKRTVNLRGGRSVSLHTIVPGMIVSFHHYNDESSGFRTRNRIDATRVVYDENGEVVFEAMSEEDALFNMPDDSQKG